MKITIVKNDGSFTVNVDRQPLPEDRFKAVCGLAAAGVYAGLVIATAALCGFPGAIVAGVVAVLGLLIQKGVEI